MQRSHSLNPPESPEHSSSNFASWSVPVLAPVATPLASSSSPTPSDISVTLSYQPPVFSYPSVPPPHSLCSELPAVLALILEERHKLTPNGQPGLCLTLSVTLLPLSHWLLISLPVYPLPLLPAFIVPFACELPQVAPQSSVLSVPSRVSSEPGSPCTRSGPSRVSPSGLHDFSFSCLFGVCRSRPRWCDAELYAGLSPVGRSFPPVTEETTGTRGGQGAASASAPTSHGRPEAFEVDSSHPNPFLGLA